MAGARGKACSCRLHTVPCLGQQAEPRFLILLEKVIVILNLKRAHFPSAAPITAANLRAQWGSHSLWKVTAFSFSAMGSPAYIFPVTKPNYTNKFPSFRQAVCALHTVLHLAFFLIMALLRRNSHTIQHTVQFTHLKCTSGGFLGYSQNYATITTINFRTFYHPQKKAWTH